MIVQKKSIDLRKEQQIPFLKFKWYSQKQFHEAHYEDTIKPFKDMPYE